MDYYYRKNLQGDIIGIINAVGTELVSYSYDVWGNILWTEDDSGRNLAELNPFRYRGYYYDTETGLYYLNSRDYDPRTGRFINADEVEYLGEDAEFSCNLYAYCANNPVMLTDEEGKFSEVLSFMGTGFLAGVAFGIKSLVTGVVAFATAITPVGWAVLIGVAVIAAVGTIVYYGEHTKNARQSTKQKHEDGQARRKRDQGGEKGDARRKPNPNKKRRGR